MDLRDDQKYDLTNSNNEAWITGRGYGSSCIIKEAIKETTSIGGKVLYISPIPQVLIDLSIDDTKSQGVFNFKEGKVTYAKTFPRLPPEDFDLILIDYVFHLPFEENLGKWRKYTESSTKVIVVGSPDFHESVEIPFGKIEEINKYLNTYYKVTIGSTFMNKNLPDIFLKSITEEYLSKKDGLSRFKLGILGMC